MNTDDLGQLVLMVHDDSATRYGVRSLIKTLQQDPEVRRNVGLLAVVNTLDREARNKGFLACVTFMLMDSELKPTNPATVHDKSFRSWKVSEVVLRARVGPWADHIHLGAKMSAYQLIKAVASRSVTVSVTKELFDHVQVLQKFWGADEEMV